jgi:CheY-like chemotaxis protein
VLVVDDDASTRELFRRVLSQEGMEVMEATDGLEALARLGEKLPSVILLDLMMPNMDGFEFVEEFRRHPEWQSIPILVVTAKNPTADARARLSGSVRTIMEKGGRVSTDLLGDILTFVRHNTPTIPEP